MNVANQTIDFLLYSRSKGINNWDIKPDNLVIKDGIVKFIDFDIAIKVNKYKATRIVNQVKY